MTDDPDLPDEAFAKRDAAPDYLFYASPRFVTHIDDQAIHAVTGLYRERLPAGGIILDLMSSWVSHLPDEQAYAAVIGHGMNAEELGANPRLTRWFVQDLNVDAALPLETASMDAVTACVSIQYLQQPVAVLRDVRRVLRPGGCLIVTFSNRCFPTKAVAVWGGLGAEDHVRLVSFYAERAGFATIEPANLIPGRSRGDPLHAVIAYAPMPVLTTP